MSFTKPMDKSQGKPTAGRPKMIHAPAPTPTNAPSAIKADPSFFTLSLLAFLRHTVHEASSRYVRGHTPTTAPEC
ncbi:MAG TPA: hypothetical protein VIP11_17625 [Gemmatimonadaceae bacterium]